MEIRNVSEGPRVIADTGDVVEPGGTVEVADELGQSLLDQEDVWKSASAHICDECGFEAETAGGLTSHRRSHDKQEE